MNPETSDLIFYLLYILIMVGMIVWGVYLIVSKKGNGMYNLKDGNSKFEFGKYKGATLSSIVRNDLKYVKWAIENGVIFIEDKRFEKEILNIPDDLEGLNSEYDAESYGDR